MKKKPGPKGPDPEVLQAMRMEIRTLHQVKRRTYGTETIYDLFEGIIPKHVIRETIHEERAKKNRDEKLSAIRYEFVAPQVAWSADFIYVEPAGRALRVQDEASRCVLGFELKEAWTDIDVTRFVNDAIKLCGAPLFFKHDLGSEFTSGVFQAMLRANRVISLPNPPYYPKANGKHERTNQAVRQWLLPLYAKFPSKEDVISEMRLALLDHNQDRKKEILGNRTPQEVYMNAKRVNLPNENLFPRWDQLKEKLLKGKPGQSRIVQALGELEAMRLAALIVLRENRLVKYFRGNEAPEVST
jgi:transposase InsO family protein